MGVAKEAQAIGGAAGRLGEALKTSFTPSGWKAAAENTVQHVEASAGFGSKAMGAVGWLFKAPFKAVGWVVLQPFKLLGGVGLKIAETPIALAMKPVKWSVNGVAATFEKFPRATPVLAAGAAAVAAGSWFAKRGSQNLQAQGEAIQQMQMAQAMQAQPSYMNSVSPEESAMLSAMQKQNGQVGGSKAEAVMAARQQMPAPESANIAAL